jgi:hypothetical protein
VTERERKTESVCERAHTCTELPDLGNIKFRNLRITEFFEKINIFKNKVFKTRDEFSLMELKAE